MHYVGKAYNYPICIADVYYNYVFMIKNDQVMSFLAEGTPAAIR